MSSDTTVGAVASPGLARKDKFGPRWIVPALLALVIVLDQATKWWAWRDVSQANINFGGDPLVGQTVGDWYANPDLGALLDLLDAALLSRAVLLLMRGPQPIVRRAFATLMIGGWLSNLLDRLGMHYVTAPGSVRGAVDFIHLGPYYFNVADFFILSATPAFLLVSGYLWTTRRLATTVVQTSAPRRRPRARSRLLAVAGAIGIVVVVALGAANYGGTTAPLTSTSASAYQ